MSTKQDPGRGSSAEPDAPAVEAPGPAMPAKASDDVRAGREPGDLTLAMSPRQIIGGFVLLAGLIAMLRRRRRKE
jgi:hypothetical protein